MTNNLSIKSIILAAGYGTRLMEIGEQLPKGLIEFNNTNLISHVVDELHTLGITDIAVVTNAKYYEQYKAWVDSQASKILLINDQTTSPENRLGALGDLRFAIDQLGWQNENILVAPSDTYFSFPFVTFFNTIIKNPAEFATIVREMNIDDIKNRLGCAVLSDTQEIIDFVEKPAVPPSPYAAIPFYYYPVQIQSLLGQYEAEGNSMDAPGNIVPCLLRNNYPVNACVVTEDTIDVGTLKELERLKQLSS